MAVEPTYLRYIYDGLIKGSIHPENAAELPEGLIGMYEEAFDERKSVIERQKLLQRFAIWALLKKEVSAAFVAEVLVETEDDIQEFISTYSAWFNSPESGKYQLYHERLKVYLLQKLSEGEVYMLHEKLINRLEQAIEEKQTDEYERYALEFLTSHMAVAAMLNGDGKKLIDLAYSQTHWQRQLKISKGYSWTKNGLKEVMSWASKYNDDEVIECGLQMVDLHHQEQNAAPQIVALVAEGDFDAALKRIEQFGGSDKEGLQRKFILYMLCLMELTLLESKNKPFRKEGIDKLLNHLDEQLPDDHSVLNWGDFFSSYLIFQISCQLFTISQDYLILFRRTKNLNTYWISVKGPYNENQIDILIECANRLHSLDKDKIFLAISVELSKKGKVEESYDCALKISGRTERLIALQLISEELADKRKVKEAYAVSQRISDNFSRCMALKSILNEIYKQGNNEQAIKFIRESIDCVKGIDLDGEYIFIILSMSNDLVKLGELEGANSLINEALECLKSMSEGIEKNKCLVDKNYPVADRTGTRFASIVGELAKQGKILEVFEFIKSIKDKSYQSDAIETVCCEFASQGKFEEALSYAEGIYEEYSKQRFMYSISCQLVKYGNIKKALSYAEEITGEYEHIKVLQGISNELVNQGFIDDGTKILLQVFDYARILSVVPKALKNSIMKSISNDFVVIGKIDEAIECAQEITDKNEKIDALLVILRELEKKDKVEEAVLINQAVIDHYKGMNEESKRYALRKITEELMIGEKIDECATLIQESIKYSKGIIYDSNKSGIIMQSISLELMKQGQISEALYFARCIADTSKKTRALRLISRELLGLNKIEEAASVLEETHIDYYDLNYIGELLLFSNKLKKIGQLDQASSIFNFIIEEVKCLNDNYLKIDAFLFVVSELVKYGDYTEASSVINDLLKFARGINNKTEKSIALGKVSSELNKLGQLDLASSVITEGMECAQSIVEEFRKIYAIEIICIELAKQGKFNEAFEFASGIRDSMNDFQFDSLMESISNELAKQGKFDEALECANGMIYFRKDDALGFLSIELAKHGKIEEALLYSKDIESNKYYSKAPEFICGELVKQGNWILAIKLGFELPERARRNKCWERLVENVVAEFGLQEALRMIYKIQDDEVKSIYLKGLAHLIEVKDCSKNSFLNVLVHYIGDLDSLELLLQNFALNNLYFDHIEQDRIERFNRTLNIQWAIEIKNQLNNNLV